MARPQLTPVEVERFRDVAAAAALELVEQEGVASLTLRRLAKRLGCSYAKPYTYYRDKEQLLDAVRGRAFDRLAEFITGAAEAGPLEPGVYLRFAFENPEAFRIMFELRQDFVSDETREAQARAWKVCAQPFHDAVAAGTLVGDPELIAHVVWAALHGLASLALANQLHLGKTVDEVAAGLRAVVDGFRPGSQKGGASWPG